ncbi:muscle M-line assembly protein unc-89 [Anabas testudineus]|uniref:muscle M-line assembly protein unc-89 n=1 Tax=Anabas testudineus TaxID=64144 RepID=UPI000E45EBF1|nr:muscle M-line assembly protein unc-89 [Anabas testudineus]
MAVAFSTVSQPGLLGQQYPPPLLPKPGKDNVRLQKLLKRTAKKKTSAQASQSTAPFRSSLSPVNEASPDLEHSDHSTPPQTPEWSFSLYSVRQPPRYTIRPLYQHVASPYPQRAAYGRGARLSPQTVAMPSYPYSQHVTTLSSYSASTHLSEVLVAQGPVAQPVVPKISLPASPVPDMTVPSAVKKPAFSTFAENQAGLGPAAVTSHQKPTSPGPTAYPTAGGRTVTRPLTVLAPLVKPKSPRPTFKATEPSRSPKPMFDVPQIRMYTATTSYYEKSRTPPVYNTSGLTSVGISIPQSNIPTETKQDLTPANEVRRGTTPVSQSPLLGPDTQTKTRDMNTIIIHTPEIKRKTPTPEIKSSTPTSEIKRATPTSEIKRATPTPEIKRATPTPEIKRATPTSEIKRATPTPEIKRATPTPEIKRAAPISEIKRATPTPEIKRATPTSEIKRATPTPEIKRATPTSEIKRATPTPEIKRATPTYELQTSRTLVGRPKTPAFHVTRATTPVFEISKPNPLLFAVSPITVEPQRSKTKPETILNEDIQSDLTPTAKPIQQSMTKAKSEPDLTREKLQVAAAGSQRPKTPTLEPATQLVTSHGFQRSMTPTYEATRLMTTSPGYKRPKTPSGVSPVAFQRPKTPTQAASKSKSAYRGLTPAEYAAHGGIKTFTPAFGISSSMTSTQEELKATKEELVGCKTSIQEPCVETPSTGEVTKLKETIKDVKEEKASTIPSIPIIVVSKASDTPGTTLREEPSMASSQVAAKQGETITKEKPKLPTAEAKTPEKQKVETPVQEVTKLKTKTAEAKQTLPQGPGQDPLKAVRKLLGKDKAQAPKQKVVPETKADVSEQKKPKKAEVTTEAKTEYSKPSSAVPAPSVKVPAVQPAGSKDKGKDAPEKKEGDEPLPAAEPLLKVMEKSRGGKSKMSGWSRLKKHMVVDQEEPKFPPFEIGSEEATGQDQSKVEKAEQRAAEQPDVWDESQTKDTAKATKMWDAVLFQMFSTKENIMYQIELNKSEEEKNKEITDDTKEIPSFAYRLPVLLFSPKFDAKKLKEAASRPVTKISTVFEMGLIGRKGKDEEPKDFNRTARGFTTS